MSRARGDMFAQDSKRVGSIRLLDGRPARPTGHRPGGAGKATSGRKECQQVGIELVFVRVR